jgi:hypothetical protein
VHVSGCDNLYINRSLNSSIALLYVERKEVPGD